MESINTWWTHIPGERYWLDVTGRSGREEILAAPRGDGVASASWTHRLITHVKGGDVAFRYDSLQRAIVGWSTASGRVQKRHLAWPRLGASVAEEATVERLPSWAIDLRAYTQLNPAISLGQIARFQSAIFPSLRALEDEVGDPLYYPFSMGSRDVTRPLPGYVFKLPAIMVEGFRDFTSTAERRPAKRKPAERRVRSLEPQLSA